VGNSRESSRTVVADEIQATAEGLKDPVEGKAAVRSRLAGFVMPLHVFAEIGGVLVSIQWSPIRGGRTASGHWSFAARRAQVAK
jgi:hypothetical protein